MTNVHFLRHSAVVIRRSGQDWLVRIVDHGIVSEQRFDNLSSAERVADAARKKLDETPGEVRLAAFLRG